MSAWKLNGRFSLIIGEDLRFTRWVTDCRGALVNLGHRSCYFHDKLTAAAAAATTISLPGANRWAWSSDEEPVAFQRPGDARRVRQT